MNSIGDYAQHTLGTMEEEDRVARVELMSTLSSLVVWCIDITCNLMWHNHIHIKMTTTKSLPDILWVYIEVHMMYYRKHSTPPLWFLGQSSNSLCSTRPIASQYSHGVTRRANDSQWTIHERQDQVQEQEQDSRWRPRPRPRPRLRPKPRPKT